MKFTFKKSLIIFLLSLIIFWPLHSVLAGIGVSPSQLTQDKALPNLQYLQTFTVSRSNSEQELNLQIQVVGTASAFLTIKDNALLTVPAKQEEAVLQVLVNIPASTLTGEYQGEINILPVVNQGAVNDLNQQFSVAVTELQINIPVKIVVQQDNVTKYAVSDIMVNTTAEKKPVEIFYTVQNQGNQAVKPKMLNLKITDLSDKKEFFNEPVDLSILSVIAPFTNQVQTVLAPIDLPAGQYWADITIQDNDCNINESRKLSLEIKKSSNYSIPESIIDPDEKSSPLVLNLKVVLALILVLGALVGIILIIGRHHKS
ncbi:MAG: hypothetical protein A2233_02835 [Candidatus Kerfeldbacteria bacterium RIFOXYA2_FULL_38_24]|uniref:Uncharacterized protein n=1 Tax=Candidatus Kerfeldbacteria bacterium RIFOXYB2_FULL_38_14 TaxID=1798547 RepID=A0A1G2BAL2_9BACT|nr:MAG: hypothetical protein A2319_00750 [Candidatus Kerfeldbacteria bacterium RIFOXYB2_FULL_38_14]OGY86470.1 MAG: hypothetical protein A2233_02835 [Candidatus Kerfeldbacteria bacterium RIFOXYA2_FULL_38_24]